MNIDELSIQLQGKKRNVSDLARFISTRTDLNPNYTILLGAGCSISSGVRPATTLVREWRDELCPGIKDEIEQKEYLKKNCGDWYDPNREYSSLFEKKYDLQRQRRMFVETEVSGRVPSIGYAYLTALVNQNYLNTIFTTNFDDLINEAFYRYSEHRPIVCAHDSSINSITVTSKRPKIIKLHGDYLFDDIKATARETESLEHNMKSKFSEFAKDYGLIVVGYAGSDRSIMDSLTALLKNDDYFKNGIYWCIRRNSDISEELRKLLWKEKVYFVEIDGFDEVFADLYSSFNNGDVLPVSTIAVTKRPSEIVSNLLKTGNLENTNSPTLKAARDKLIKQSKKATLMSLVFKPEKDEFMSESADEFSDDEAITQIEIQNLIDAGNYHDAISKARGVMKGTERIPTKCDLLYSIISAHRYLGETSEAAEAVDELINIDPYSATPYLLKAEILCKLPDRHSSIDAAIEANPYYVKSYWRKAALYKLEAKNSTDETKGELYRKAIELLDLGLTRDPSLGNYCWISKFDLIKSIVRDKNERTKKLQDIVGKLEIMNPYSSVVLSMKMKLLPEGEDTNEVKSLLEQIDRAKQRIRSKKSSAILDEVWLQAALKSGNKQRIVEFLKNVDMNYELSSYPDLAIEVSNALRKIEGKDDEAISLLLSCLDVKFNSDVFGNLIPALADIGNSVLAQQLYDKWSNRLSISDRCHMRLAIFESQKKYDEALFELRKLVNQVGIQEDTNMIYYMLLKGAFQEAEKYGKEILTKINWSLDAETEIINYEVAIKRIKGKANIHRLEKLMQYTENQIVKAAIHALLNNRKDMIEAIKKVMRSDLGFRFEAMKWPVFEEYRNDSDFKAAISLPDKNRMLTDSTGSNNLSIVA